MCDHDKEEEVVERPNLLTNTSLYRLGDKAFNWKFCNFQELYLSQLVVQCLVQLCLSLRSFAIVIKIRLCIEKTRNIDCKHRILNCYKSVQAS